MRVYHELRTEELPPRDRFAHWYDQTRRELVPTVVRSDHEGDFRASIRLLELGDVRVSAHRYPSLRTYRSDRLVRESDPEQLVLWCGRQGSIGWRSTGSDVLCRGSAILCYDTSRPFTAWVTNEHGRPAEGIMVQVPRAALPLPTTALHRLTGTPLPAGDGLGAVLTGYLVELARQGDRCRAADAARLRDITLDLVAAFLHAQPQQTGTALPETARRRALQSRIHEFIRRRLGDPELSPRLIAEAHHVSLRHLHKLFEEQGLTVAGWIRRRRLEHCRRDLADPRLRHRAIQQIAAGWGLPDATHFSRIFRAAYGLPPGEYRRAALAGEFADLAGEPAELPAATAVRAPTTAMHRCECRPAPLTGMLDGARAPETKELT